MDFFDALGGPSWTDNSSWTDDSVALEAWFGVTATVDGNGTECVRFLDLTGNNLVGESSSSEELCRAAYPQAPTPLDCETQQRDRMCMCMCSLLAVLCLSLFVLTGFLFLPSHPSACGEVLLESLVCVYVNCFCAR